MARKFSRQRETIKKYLSTRKDHPSADAVYTAVREEMPNIRENTLLLLEKVICVNGVVMLRREVRPRILQDHDQ